MSEFTLNHFGAALCYTVRNLHLPRLLRLKNRKVIGMVNAAAPEETQRQ